MFVEIDNEDALEMLVERVRFWTDDDDVVDLFAEYYSNALDGGMFDGGEFNVQNIVDNDYINWTEFGTREDIMERFDDFDESKVLAESGDLILYYAC